MDLTYGQLKSEVARRLIRTDLAVDIATHIQERIEYYGKEFFYSSETDDSTTVTTVAGTRYYNLGARWSDVRYIQLLNGVWIPMTRKDVIAIEIEDSLEPPLQSIPTDWCIQGGVLRVWPCGGPYKLSLSMNRNPAPPVNDPDVTFWSTDGQSVIIAATCEKICQLLINSPVREAEFRNERIDQERALGSKSIRAMGGIKLKGYL
jgi:hypothetical protein